VGGSGFFPVPKAATKGATASEDCLNLNIWTPGLDAKKRPVMVYFHGGAYNNGSVNVDLYDGVRLCKRGDVVVVKVNGRLNGFGFLYLADLCGKNYADSGNVGMLDLILALRWVHDNIAAFGGDPGCVTIFGQSGGGAKCSTLMAMPAAKGLFHRVITMSGQQITGRTREHANVTAKAVLEKWKIKPEEIGKVDAMTMAQVMEGLRGGEWTPVVDGVNLPQDPFGEEASPVSAEIPMMKGNTREETASLIGGGNEALNTLTWEQLPGQIDTSVRQYLGGLLSDDVVRKYRELYPDYSASDVFFAVTTAARSWKSMLVEVESRARQGKGPLYVYQLDWRTPVDGGKWRACHTLDIPLAFDNVGYGRRMVGNGPDAQRMADLMSDSFVAFARTGNPSTKEIGTWPVYRFGGLAVKASMDKLKK
jgi:para-nitrobenzyl esterase